MLAVYSIIICTLCYLVCSIDNLRQKDFPHALVWFAYATANIGFLWYELTKNKE